MKAEIYRCGYCGDVTDEVGNPLEGYIREDVMNLIESDKNVETIQTHGECCVYNEMMKEEQRRMVQVSREMAIDAGYPEMEGRWIKW